MSARIHVSIVSPSPMQLLREMNPIYSEDQDMHLLDSNRRSFLKRAGFATAALLSGCAPMSTTPSASPAANDLPSGLPPLHRAAGLGDAEEVQTLLRTGADPSHLDPRIGASPLHLAAQSGNVDIGRLLLNAGAYLNLQAPSHGMTPLMVAVWHRRPAFVSFLLEQPAINAGLRNHLGLTAAEVVGLGSRPADGEHTLDREIRDLFAAYARRLQQTREQQPLIAVLTSQSLSASQKRTRVKALLAKGADPNTASPRTNSGADGQTPLHLAAQANLAEITRDLLEAGADQRIPDAYVLAIPAHRAAYFGHADVLRALVADRSFVDVANAQGPFNGYTPLHDAAWHGHAEAASVLVAAGVRTDVRGWDGRTALDIARENGYADTVAVLQGKTRGDQQGR